MPKKKKSGQKMANAESKRSSAESTKTNLERGETFADEMSGPDNFAATFFATETHAKEAQAPQIVANAVSDDAQHVTEDGPSNSPLVPAIEDAAKVQQAQGSADTAPEQEALELPAAKIGETPEPSNASGDSYDDTGVKPESGGATSDSKDDEEPAWLKQASVEAEQLAKEDEREAAAIEAYVLDRMASAAEDAERLTTRDAVPAKSNGPAAAMESVAEAQKESAMTGFEEATAEEVERAAEEAMQKAQQLGAIADAAANGEDAAAAEAAFQAAAQRAHELDELALAKRAASTKRVSARPKAESLAATLGAATDGTDSHAPSENHVTTEATEASDAKVAAAEKAAAARAAAEKAVAEKAAAEKIAAEKAAAEKAVAEAAAKAEAEFQAAAQKAHELGALALAKKAANRAAKEAALLAAAAKPKVEQLATFGVQLVSKRPSTSSEAAKSNTASVKAASEGNIAKSKVDEVKKPSADANAATSKDGLEGWNVMSAEDVAVAVEGNIHEEQAVAAAVASSAIDRALVMDAEREGGFAYLIVAERFWAYYRYYTIEGLDNEEAARQQAASTWACLLMFKRLPNGIYEEVEAGGLTAPLHFGVVHARIRSWFADQQRSGKIKTLVERSATYIEAS